jgi:hypothetical protein
MASYEQQVEIIRKLESSISKSEGAAEQLKSQLISEFGVGTVEEAVTLLSKIEQEIRDNTTLIEEYLVKLRSLADWDSITV